MPVRRLLPLAFAVALAAAACGGGNSGSSSAGVATTATPASAAGPATPASASSGENVSLRLGYFPNITHATALVGVDKGIFADKLGPNVKLERFTYNALPSAIAVLLAAAI